MTLAKFGRQMFSYRGLTLLSAPAAVLVAAGVVMGSSAALSASTDNSGNTWATAPVELTLENDAVSMLFSATDMTAGYSETHCITITNSSPVPATVKGFGTNLQESALGDAMTLDVLEGSGGIEAGGSGSGDHCEGFVPEQIPAVYSGSLASYAQDDYSTGFGSKVLEAGESVQYRVTATLPSDADAPGALSELTTGIDFSWEIQK